MRDCVWGPQVIPISLYISLLLRSCIYISLVRSELSVVSVNGIFPVDVENGGDHYDIRHVRRKNLRNSKSQWNKAQVCCSYISNII